MSDVVVKLSTEAEREWWNPVKSTLRHASEKAIESYFSLFHLLVCLAVSNPQIVRDANREVLRFLNGQSSKTHFPNLGHFIVVALVSDQGLDSSLTLAIVYEAIVRNVVWMLDKEAPELSYLVSMLPKTSLMFDVCGALARQNTNPRLSSGTSLGDLNRSHVIIIILSRHGMCWLSSADA